MTRKLLTLAALAVTLSAQSFDGNGALEAFYVKPAHHSILKSKTFWVSVAVITGSGALGGYMLSRGGHAAPVTPFQQPALPLAEFERQLVATLKLFNERLGRALDAPRDTSDDGRCAERAK